MQSVKYIRKVLISAHRNATVKTKSGTPVTVHTEKKLSDEEEKILEYARKHGAITRNDVIGFRFYSCIFCFVFCVDIRQYEVNAVFDEQVRLCADTLKRKAKEYTGDDPDRQGHAGALYAVKLPLP